jgi:hypothetical protein
MPFESTVRPSHAAALNYNNSPQYSMFQDDIYRFELHSERGDLYE